LENLNQELNSKINILKEEAIYLNEQVTKLTLEAEGNPPISQYPSLNTIAAITDNATTTTNEGSCPIAALYCNKFRLRKGVGSMDREEEMREFKRWRKWRK
jgi:hypothetical protein